MRKQLIAISAAVVVVIAASTTGLIAHHSHLHSQEIATAAHTKALADWQQKVKAWNAQQMQKQQVATTAQQSDLQQQGVNELPDTGAGNMVVFALGGGLAAYGVHQVVLRRKFAS